VEGKQPNMRTSLIRHVDSVLLLNMSMDTPNICFSIKGRNCAGGRVCG
jgi:hypothetical protein